MADHRVVLSPDLFSHGSRSSTSRSDLLKLPFKKMYYTVKTSELDQHTHRFLWRDMDSTRETDTYITQRVSFGDTPSGTIATIALRKTAEMTRNEHPEAADIIQSVI